MKVHTYEKVFLTIGAIMLVVFLGALFYASAAMGIHLPGPAGTVDPAAVMKTPPFNAPGVHQTGPNQYQAVIVGYAWGFLPTEIRVPAGAEITFTATTLDVIHGFELEGTHLNMMLIPGRISQNTYRFTHPGTHLLICHEYCGLGHQTMHATVIVE
jgi:cytochrome c oxidase subunit 2